MNNQERYNQEIDEMLSVMDKITLAELQDNIDAIIIAACELDEMTTTQPELHAHVMRIHECASTIQPALDRLEHENK